MHWNSDFESCHEHAVDDVSGGTERCNRGVDRAHIGNQIDNPLSTTRKLRRLADIDGFVQSRPKASTPPLLRLSLLGWLLTLYTNLSKRFANPAAIVGSAA